MEERRLEMRRDFLDTPFGQIHYATEGSGESVLLLHQTARSMNEYEQVIPLIAKKYRVIAMDTLGYGDSDKPNRCPTIANYAETVLMLIDTLGLSKISIVGHHTGAYIGVEVASTYPDRVEKAVLSGPAPTMFSEDKPEIPEPYEEWYENWKNWLGKETREDGSHLIRAWELFRKHDPSLRADRLNKRLLDYLKAGDTGIYAYDALATYRMEDRLPLIECPTLVLFGTNDFRSFGLGGDEEKVAEAIPRSKMVWVEGATYCFPDQLPEKFAQLVLEFLKEPGL
jgi:pimeloyl-ACP methyl ester carboxylesterase